MRILLLLLLLLPACRTAKPPTPQPAAVTEAAQSANQARKLSVAANWSGAAREWETAASEYFLLNDLTNAAIALHNLAQAQMELRQYDLAMTNLHHAADLNHRLRRDEEWFRNQIAILQAEALAGRTNEARIEQLRKKIDAITDSSVRGTFLNEVALFQKSRGDLNAALETFQRASAEFASAKDRHGSATVLANQAKLFEAQMNYPAALDAWQAALRDFEALADPPGITRSLVGMGRTLVAAKQNLPRAENLLRQAARNYRTLGQQASRREAVELLAQALEAQNKFEEAAAVRRELRP